MNKNKLIANKSKSMFFGARHNNNARVLYATAGNGSVILVVVVLLLVHQNVLKIDVVENAIYFSRNGKF